MAQSYDYASVVGVNREEFLAKKANLNNSNATRTNKEDIEKMEDLLHLQRGILSGQDFFVTKQVCSHCGRTPNFYDIVKTAVDENHHSISLMAHTPVGNKFILNPPRIAKCSNCATPLDLICEYDNEKYGCCWQP